MKRKFFKILSILLTVIIPMSLFQLPVFAAVPEFRDTSLIGGHRYWIAPYGDELAHYDYFATDGSNSVSYVVNYPANGTPRGVKIDPDGVFSMDYQFGEREGWPTAMNIRASSDDFSTYLQSKNINYQADSPYIHNFDTDPYALSNGLIYDRDDLTSTVVLENADVVADENNNNYVVEKDSSKNYIGFRPHFAGSAEEAGSYAATNSTILQFDVNLSSSEPFSIAFNSSSYPILRWNNATQQLVESPYAARPYTTFNPPASVEPGWHNVKIMFDFRKKAASNPNPHRETYQRGAIFFDDELVVSNFELPSLNLYNNSNPTRIIRFEGSDGIDNLKYYGSSTPHAYGVGLASEPKSGSEVAGSASMYSLGNFTNSETRFEYSFYVSESNDSSGSYTKVTSTDSAEPLYITDEGNLFINSDYTGHFIKVGARVWNRGGLSPEIMSKEVYEIQENDEEPLEPYIIYDAETATAPITRIYDRYYETKRPIVEIDGRKGVPWGPSDAGTWKADADKADQRGTAGDLANRPTNFTVVDANGNTKIPMADYQYLVVEMYSANNTNQPFLWRLYDGTTGGKFYTAGFNANWEGEWKQIRLAIAGGLDDCGEFKTSSTPAGLPYQSKMMQLVANTSSALYTDTEVYIGKIYLEGNREARTVPNNKGEIILPDYYDPSTMTDYVSMLKENHPNKAHPRLIVSEDKLNRIIQYKDTDDFMGLAYERVKAKADALLDEATSPATYIQNGAIAFSRKVEEVAKNCGLMYLLTGNEEYAERVWEEAEVMINCDLLWSDTTTGLDAQHISNGMALLYDWCYDYLTDAQKLDIRNALMKNAFAFASRIRGGGGYMGYQNNVVAANSRGFMTAALAICDEPGYEDFCNEYINNVVTYIQPNLMHQFVPDGNYGEGIGYWTYTVESLMFMTDAMLSSIGSDGGIQQMPGLGESCYFPFVLRGGNYAYNFFNFSDSGRNLHQNLSPVYHYLSEVYNMPALRAYRLDTVEIDENKHTAEDLLWYNPELPYDTVWSSGLPKDYFLDGMAPIVSMRSGYGKTGELGKESYLAAKGGNGKVGHVQYDAGTFVLDAVGKRWIHDLGSEVYGGASPDYYYYRTRTEGHNCIVFDPERGWEAGTGQTVARNLYDTKCPIVASGSGENEAFSILDLQPSYTETVEEYKRGFALVNGRTQFIIQDEFTTKEPFELYSYFHIDQSTEIVSSDGQSLILRSRNPVAYCKVDFITDIEDFEIGVMQAVHHPASPQADPSASTSVKGHDNSDFKKFYFRADNVEDATITVVFTPMTSQNSSVTLPTIKTLANWNEYIQGSNNP